MLNTLHFLCFKSIPQLTAAGVRTNPPIRSPLTENRGGTGGVRWGGFLGKSGGRRISA